MEIVNIEELAEQLEKDFKNADIESVVDKVRSDIKKKIKKKHQPIFS